MEKEERIGEEFQRGMEKFQNAKRAGPVVDQPSRLRTPPGVGGEGWPVSLLCSRNARPRKGLVGRAQLETKRTTPLKGVACKLGGTVDIVGGSMWAVGDYSARSMKDLASQTPSSIIPSSKL